MKVRLLVAVGMVVTAVGAFTLLRFTEVPSTPIWLAFVTAAVGLLSTLVTDMVSSRLQSISQTRRDIGRLCLSDANGVLPKVDGIEDLLPLGIHAPTGNEGTDTRGRNTSYVPRDADPDLDQALARGGLVIATGPSLSGRSRSMFEAVKRVYPKRALVVPRDSAAFGELVRIGVPHARGVVWLDRLERYINERGLDFYTLVQQVRSTRSRGVIVGTIDSEAAPMTDDGVAAESLRYASQIPFLRRWSAGELSRAEHVANEDRVLAAALRRASADGHVVSALVADARPRTFSPVVYVIPPKPTLFGRDEQVAEVVAALTHDPAEAVCVNGPPGIGKATVLRAALHAPAIARAYGQRRIYIRCDMSVTADAVLADVAVALGIELGADARGRVLSALQTAPTALFLCGLTEALQRDARPTQDLLDQFAAMPGVGLAVTVRGATMPVGPIWRTIRLRRLDHETSKKLFLSVAGPGFRSDPHLDNLVASQDGVPLALEMLAFSAQGEPNLAGLWRNWAARSGVAPVKVADGYNQFDTSVEIAIESIRMNESSATLMAVLGVLPDGIDHRDLERLMPGTGDVAAATLRKVGLAYDEQNRLRMLKPVQDFVARTRPVPEAVYNTVQAHYLSLAQDLGEFIGAANGSLAAARLVAESANIESMIRRGLASDTPGAAARAAYALASFTRYTGLGGTELLREATAAAQRVSDRTTEAHCIYHLADLDLRQSRPSEALQHFRDAERLLEQVGDTHLLAETVKHIGDALFELCRFQEAAEYFSRSEALYQDLSNRRGAANSIKCLGDVYERRAHYREASTAYNSALSAFQAMADNLGVADCQRRLADVDLAQENAGQALELYQAAARAYEGGGAVLGLANCHLGQANVALLQGDPDTAMEFIQRAEPLYARMKYVRGQARCIEALGRLAAQRGDSDAANEHFACAQELFTDAADVIGVADCLLGRSRLASGQDAADLATQALAQYESVGRIVGIALANERLAELASSPEARIPRARAAIDAWTQMGKDATAARVAAEHLGE